MIGRYLDALAAAGFERSVDRIIEAQLWRTGTTLPDADGARCLVGHVVNQSREGCDTDVSYWSGVWGKYGTDELRVMFRFDDLANRFGMDRVVRAIKLRAGKHTRVPMVAEPATTESAV